jgi:hypothetical protein
MDLETLNYIKTIFDKDGHEQAYKELCAKIKSLDSEPQFDSRGRKLCRCGSKPKDHEVRNFDPVWCMGY